MARKYTAQEMRDYADAIAGDLEDNDHGGVEYFYDDLIPVVEALRQAADELEREKKYEYTVKYEDGVISRLHYDCVEPLENGRNENHRIVRREVGEWEEVK